MYNRRFSCLPWLPNRGRQVLLASVLCLVVLGLSAFSFAPSTQAASMPAKQVFASTAQLNSNWHYWSVDRYDQPCFGPLNCPQVSIHLHADGVYNPVIQQIWQWHVTCTASGYQVLGYALCTWHGYFGNGTRYIQVGVDGVVCSNIAVVEGVCYSDVGIRVTIDAYGGIVSDYQWAHY